VRVEGPDGEPLPGNPEFRAYRAEAAGRTKVAFTARRDDRDRGVWVLSAFRPGKYTITADLGGQRIGKAEVSVDGTESVEARIVPSER
jgi:hypothetical protein